MSSNAVPRRNVRFRGRSFMAFVLTPDTPVTAWLDTLDDTLRRSAGFFAGRPVILDVTGLDLTREGLKALVEALYTRGIRILGLEGADESIVDLTLPPLLSNGRPASGIVMAPDKAKADSKPQRAERPVRGASLLIEEPIRSGQSIVYLDGDVTVLGAVGSGAEIVAGGSIHVYGALRGRALAGAKGNAKARIFAFKNEAELLAIDSLYITADEVQKNLRGRPVQVWLESTTIRIAGLD